jgi:TetR/AcrR family transcriptional regulator of autoinduction and epiphytic fitness
MSRKQRDTSKKRAEIVAAAIQAFQAEGYDNTSMDRIAEVAGASKRTVYNHFPSKEELFSAAIEVFLDRATELKKVVYDRKRSLEEQLRDFAEAKSALLRDQEWIGFVRVGLGVLVRDPELAQATISRAQADEDHLVAWLKDATADGRLAVNDPELVAQLFWSTLAGGLFWPHVLKAPMRPSQEKRLKEELVRSVIEGYAL